MTQVKSIFLTFLVGFEECLSVKLIADNCSMTSVSEAMCRRVFLTVGQGGAQEGDI